MRIDIQTLNMTMIRNCTN